MTNKEIQEEYKKSPEGKEKNEHKVCPLTEKDKVQVAQEWEGKEESLKRWTSTSCAQQWGEAQVAQEEQEEDQR